MKCGEKGESSFIRTWSLSTWFVLESRRGTALLVCFVVLWGTRAFSQSDEPQYRAAEDAMRAGRYDTAAQEYGKLVKERPESPELWSNLGSAQALGGDCQRALATLEKARSLNPKLAGPWYFIGLCRSQFHEHVLALSALQRAVELNPGDPNAWYLLAQSAVNLDQLGVALEGVVHALALNPQRPELYYTAGAVALDLVADCYSRLQKGEAAYPYTYRLEGERDIDEGVWKVAATAYLKVAELEPRAADVHFALGTVYWKSVDLAEAEAEFIKSAELSSNPTWSRLRLVRVLIEAEKTSQASRLLQSISLEHLEDLEEYEDFLMCASLLKLMGSAEAALRQGRSRFPNNPELGQWASRLASPKGKGGSEGSNAIAPQHETQAGLAVHFVLLSDPRGENFVVRLFSSPAQYRHFRSAFLRGDCVAAARIISPLCRRLPAESDRAFALGEVLHWLSYRFYQELGTRFPDSTEAQMLAAENFSAAGQQAKALEIYQGLLARNGPSPVLLHALAQVHWTQHEWDEALKDLQSLAELDSFDPTPFVNIARIYSYRYDLDNAERYFRRALEVDPRIFEGHLGLGETLRRKGDEEAALRELKLASQIDPSNPRPHYELSQIYRRRQMKNLADQEMTAFQRLQGQAPSRQAAREKPLVPID